MPLRRCGSESAPRSIVQTGDILNTERNAARVLFRKTERAIERTKGMNTEENKVTLTTEAMSKISELASKHSANIEDADSLRAALKETLAAIVSYCCFGEDDKILARKTKTVEVNIVPTVEKVLCVTVKMGGGEKREEFKRGTVTQNGIEERFLKMLDC